jgi:hypothetical protein
VTSPQPPLPHAELAVVPAAKLRDYVLNPAQVRGPCGRAARVRTGWIIRSGDMRPHLTTAHVDLP